MSNEREEGALKTPPTYDPFWREKIDIARQERESARKANEKAKRERRDKSAKGKGRRRSQDRLS